MPTNVQEEILAALQANGEKLEEIHESIELSGGARRKPTEPSPGLDCLHQHLDVQWFTSGWRCDHCGTVVYFDALAQPPHELASPPKTITLSSLLRDQQQHSLGDPLRVLFGILFFNVAQISWWSARDWSKHEMVWHSADQLGFKLTYTYKGMNPDASGFHSGAEKVLTDTDYEEPGLAWLIDLTAETTDDNPLGFEREESVTLEQSSSTEMTHSTEIDIGIKNTLTIGGEEAGVKLEDSIETAFDYKDADEEKKATAQSQSRTQSVKIETSFDPPSAHLAEVISQAIRSNTMRGWHGVTEYGIKIEVPLDYYYSGERSWYPAVFKMIGDHRYKHVTRGSKSYGQWEWKNWLDFLAWLDGSDTESGLYGHDAAHWPVANLGGWTHALQRARDDIADGQKSRRIDLDGIEHRDYKSGARFRVSDVTGQDLDAIARRRGAQIVTR